MLKPKLEKQRVYFSAMTCCNNLYFRGESRASDDRNWKVENVWVVASFDNVILCIGPTILFGLDDNFIVKERERQQKSIKTGKGVLWGGGG